MTRLAHTRIVTKNVPRLASFYEQISGTAAVGSEEYVSSATGSPFVANAR
jgi:hypothetical protein